MQSIDTNGSLPKDRAQLAQWHTKVEGFPRGLEALVGYLNGGETRSIQDLLDDPALFGANVLDKIVGKVIATLPTALQRVLCAVSVIGQTATRADLEYALAPHVDTTHLHHALDWLVAGRYLIHNNQTRAFSLHPLDVAYLSDNLPVGDLSFLPPTTTPQKRFFNQVKRLFAKKNNVNASISQPFTRYALAYRMAELYHQKAEQNTTWESIADLTPHLREMEYRMMLGDYDTVASIFLKMDFDYLLLWGHTELVLDWHTRLEGLVKNPDLARVCIGNLGTTYAMIGNAEKAITYYQKALDMARAQKNKQGEGAWLGNLGNAYLNLGDIEQAIGYYEQALTINREVKDKRSEGNQLGNLGNAYLNLGEIERAIGYYEQALTIDREIKDRAGEGNQLGNLGVAYERLGDIKRAIDYYEQALTIARKIKDKSSEGLWLGNLGSAKTLLGRYAEAISDLRDSIELMTEVKNARDLPESIARLAQTFWFSDDISNALIHIRQAREYHAEIYNHMVACLHGCIALCAGLANEAKIAFDEALIHADALLAKTAKQYGAMYSRGLALAGLWMVTGETDYRARAVSAYTDAMAVNRAAGVLLDNRQMLEAVARCAGADVVGWL